MSVSKLRSELFLMLWILLLYQISAMSCATLQHSTKSDNYTVIQSNMSQPENLSGLVELPPESPTVNHSGHEINEEKKSNPANRHQASLSFIEFGPSDDDSDFERHYEIPKIITFKVRAGMHVLNPYSDSHSQKPNFNSGPMRQASLSDIEFGPSGPDVDFEFHSSDRKKRMNNLNEESNVLGKGVTESQLSSTEDIFKSIEKDLETEDSSEDNKVVQNVRRSKYATGRQFLFHPYLQMGYGKDTPSDEKIFFDDILPVKMVKFVKNMVEEAPWEQMFMKMVRMIVDQFVDKIIEKMFADKGDDHHFKKRSFNVVLTPTFVLPTFETPIVRLKRSVSTKTSPDQDEDIFNYWPPPKKSVQDTNGEGKKGPEENKTWLDHFLDFVFPNTKDDMFDLDSLDRLQKRDTRNSNFLKTLVAFFLRSFEKSSGFLFNAKDVFRYKMLKEYLPYLYQKRYGNKNPADSPSTFDATKMTHRRLPDRLIERNDVSVGSPDPQKRSKRSTRDHSKDDEERLWQAPSNRHKPSSHRSHDECSLRKACNAGRLLSRLPSVQEITLQLRSNGNEPHWDAMIWGMKKKRCSRIFCKRQRSPKGSRFYWNTENERKARRDEIVTEPDDAESDESNLTT